LSIAPGPQSGKITISATCGAAAAAFASPFHRHLLINYRPGLGLAFAVVASLV